MSKKKVSSPLSESVGINPTKSPEQEDYETQNHMDTILKAHGIMEDEGKMEKVHALAGRHHKVISGLKAPKEKPIRSIQDLKDKRNSMLKGKKKTYTTFG